MSSKAVVFAYHDIGCAGIEALLNTGYEIAAVFTHADDPKENNFYGSVAQLCARNGIPVHAPEDANHPLWIERIAKLNPEYIFSFYYRNLLSEPLLATASKGAFNLHGSLLPKYRGRAPANWVLVNGETETGVTLHRMVKRADAGAIVAQQRVAIERSDTALSLHGKLRIAATDLAPSTGADAWPPTPRDLRPWWALLVALAFALALFALMDETIADVFAQSSGSLLAPAQPQLAGASDPA